MIDLNAKIDTQRVRYPVVKQALSQTKYQQTHDDVTALLIWWDGNINSNQLLNVLPHQRISRFPGMDFICYKSTTFKSLNYMRSMFPRTYSFYPTTYLLPYQFSDFQKEHLKIAASTGHPITWIFKPRSGCCGNGIKLIQNSFEVSEPSNSGVIQKYVSPYLLDNYKFDFRFFIFIATSNPFTAYIYNEGLARFCSQPYSPPTKENLSDRFCHLTNTAVNVNNGNSTVEICQLASTVIEKIKSNDDRGNMLWRKIKEVAALVLLSQYKNIMEQIKIQENENRSKQKTSLGSPSLPVPFDRKFFHVIGIDVMLNENCEPILLEMNDRPSMCVTYELENKLKTKLIFDVLNILTVDGKPPPPTAEFGGWEQILPVDDSNPFSKVVNRINSKIQQKSNSIVQIMPKQKLFFPRETKFSRTRGHVNYFKGLPSLKSSI